jgi:hypothetical protein
MPTNPTDITVQMLLLHGMTDEKPLSRERWNRITARVAWFRETSDAWLKAQHEMDDRCTAAVDRVTEQEFNLLFDAEQAKVDAIRAPLQAVVDEDRWPRHLHFSGI